MKYGYVRVSSRSQKIDGNSLEAQRNAVKEAGAEEIVIETYTGTKVDRPQLTELLSAMSPGDTLIVTKMDRFARTVAQATETINDLLERGINIYVLNLGMLDNSSMSVLLRNLLLSFAQFERDTILERTQEGKAIARLKPGFKEGRPKKYKPEQIELAMQLLETNSYKRVSLMTGISESTLVRSKREINSKKTQ